MKKVKKACRTVCVLLLAMTIILLEIPQLANSFGGGVLNSKAAVVSHTKATSADVLTPDANNKKGVQGSEVMDWCKNSANGETLQSLGINHIMFNVNLTDIISTNGTGKPYVYKGKTYYFNDAEGSMLKVYKARVKELREMNVAVTFCLVLGWSNNPEIQKLMYNPQPGKVYYALNSSSSEQAVRDHVEAILYFMAEEFSYSDTFVQYWRVGNEVNVSHDYNYTGAGTGGISLKSTIITLAVDSYDIMYKALAEKNPYAKVYVSVTHDWNNDNSGTGVPTKEFLDTFSTRTGSKNWNIDFHAYPPQMHEQVWTKATSAYLRNDEDTKFICAPNLNVLTDYVKNKFGSNHRIMLSEQSFDSKYGQEEQAAMIAYTYYAGANNDMIDAVILTTWQDTNSIYHDNYDMGVLDYNGNKKASFNVFKNLNTSGKSTYVDPYLDKLSLWTGRTISSWTDNILYKIPATSVTLQDASIYYPADYQEKGSVFIGLTTNPSKDIVDLEYTWSAYNYTTKQTMVVSGWTLNNEWLKWYPQENATYRLTCTVRVAGNPASTMQKSHDINFYAPELPNSVDPALSKVGEFAKYDGHTFHRDTNGNVTCKDSAGKPVVNGFRCDGTYTYYFQLDGTAMRNRLTYHPDGVHVIYFDGYGHEVFSNFHHVEKSIAGDAVDDLCFFDVYGYMYVDVMTYDQAGKNLYYVNPYGVIEQGKWFEFSDTCVWAGTDNKVGKGYGYANADGTLMINTYTYDWLGRYVYLQGNGHIMQ